MATLHRLLLVSLFTAFALTAQSTASAQTLPSTGRVANIGYAINNPFTARRISEPLDGSPSAAHRPFEFELVARDSAGRIRLERHDVRKFPAGQKQTVLHSRDGRERTVSEEEMGLLITVFDYPAGKLYAIQPGMQIVHVHERTRPQTSAAPELPYSYFSLSLLHENPIPLSWRRTWAPKKSTESQPTVSAPQTWVQTTMNGRENRSRYPKSGFQTIWRRL